MHATAEPIVWAIRVGEENKKFGDPWSFAVICTYNGDTAWLHVGRGEITPRIMKALGEALRGLGFRRVEWEQAGEDGRFVRIAREL